MDSIVKSALITDDARRPVFVVVNPDEPVGITVLRHIYDFYLLSGVGVKHVDSTFAIARRP